MPSLRPRFLAAPVALLLLAGACGGDEADDAAPSTTTAAGTGSGTTDEGGATTTAPAEEEGVIEVRIVGGNVEGGARREKVELGSEITLRFTSDVAEEIHVHTYDRLVDLVAGQTASVTFVADIPGIHEVELHGSGRKVLDLEVS